MWVWRLYHQNLEDVSLGQFHADGIPGEYSNRVTTTMVPASPTSDWLSQHFEIINMFNMIRLDFRWGPSWTTPTARQFFIWQASSSSPSRCSTYFLWSRLSFAKLLTLLEIFIPTQDHKALREAKKEAADASLVLGKFPGCNLGEEIYKNISSSVPDYMLIYC